MTVPCDSDDVWTSDTWHSGLLDHPTYGAEGCAHLLQSKMGVWSRKVLELDLVYVNAEEENAEIIEYAQGRAWQPQGTSIRGLMPRDLRQRRQLTEIADIREALSTTRERRTDLRQTIRSQPHASLRVLLCPLVIRSR